MFITGKVGKAMEENAEGIYQIEIEIIKAIMAKCRVANILVWGITKCVTNFNKL